MDLVSSHRMVWFVRANSVVGLKQSVAGTGQAVRLNAFSATELTLTAAAESMARGTPFSEPRKFPGQL